ncbi:hypothetical protein ADEAN_000432300 [Angomonas deanei]|uniref:MINDY4 N-terminal dimerisation domain-containing protein n=1 Tax=Angomonas deanei TaxID=59799 RepID=A0A7G2CBL2_9TRYP|nr:hypothetical protein ADEAN_000432300 [Angomonas deanei]
MPPKKDISNAPVYRMNHEDQVRLLSEALLREYMHKLGFKETLKAFDEENPRGEETISSRALMSDLMALHPDTSATLKEKGLETIMEMLCGLRVERRMEVAALQEAVEEIVVPEVPEAYEALKEAHERRLQKKKDKQNSMDGDGTKKKKKDKKSKKSKSSSKPAPDVDEFGLPLDPTMTIDDLLGSSTEESEVARRSQEREEEDEEEESQLPDRKQSTQEYITSSNALGAAAEGEESFHGDVGDAIFPGAQPLAPEAATTAFRILCGKAAAPPDSFIPSRILI